MKTRLRLGAILHFIIAIGHVACLFFLEEAFKAYDILDEMTSMCFGQAWLLYVLTIALALAFAVAGLYALSAAGDIKRLLLQRLVIIAIVVVHKRMGFSQVAHFHRCGWKFDEWYRKFNIELQFSGR